MSIDDLLFIAQRANAETGDLFNRWLQRFEDVQSVQVVFQGTLEDAHFPPACFDAVTLWDTIGRKVIDTVSYAGVLHRAVIADEPGEIDATEGDAGAPPDSNSTTGSLARAPNGRDTGQNGADFRFVAALSPGGPNP